MAAFIIKVSMSPTTFFFRFYIKEKKKQRNREQVKCLFEKLNMKNIRYDKKY